MTAALHHRRQLTIALAITVTLMIAEIVTGVMSGSLALLADAGHMLTDAGALGMSLLVIWLSAKPPTARRTFGYRRTEILAALANGVMLWVTVGVVAREAYLRLKAPSDIQIGPMLVVACLGLAANLVSAYVLRDSQNHSHGQNLNMRSAYLHVLTDSWGSVGVIVAALVVAKTGYRQADPLVSFLICGLILFSSWGLIRDSVMILLEATPRHLNTGDIRSALLAVPGVTGVHDLHIWTVTSGFDALSGHIIVQELNDTQPVLRRAHQVLAQNFSITHSTLQIEVGKAGDVGIEIEHR